jgi:hypothetical protein
MDNPEQAGAIAGQRAGQLYRAAAARGGLADVCALPLRILEARIEAQCMVVTDCTQTQLVGRLSTHLYAAPNRRPGDEKKPRRGASARGAYSQVSFKRTQIVNQRSVRQSAHYVTLELEGIAADLAVHHDA